MIHKIEDIALQLKILLATSSVENYSLIVQSWNIYQVLRMTNVVLIVISINY